MRITNDCVVIWVTGSEPGPQAFEVDPDLEPGDVEIPFPDVNVNIQRKPTKRLGEVELFDLAEQCRS